VVWGVVSEDDADCQIMVNLPTDSYVSASGATLDADATTVYDIPTDFIGTGFLIARLVCRHQVSGNTYSIVSNIDLRGTKPSTSAGGTVGGGVTAFGDLSDGDSTGVLDNDILYRASGVWVPSAGAMTFDGTDLVCGGNVSANGNFLLEGHDGQRNIIRAERLRLQPGATPGTNINVTPNTSDSAAFNNQVMDAATDLAKSGASGDFSLSANGRVLTLELGNVIGVVSATIQIGDINSSSSTETYYADVAASGSDVLLQFYLQGTSTSVDITTIMDAGDLLDVLIFYVTNT